MIEEIVQMIYGMNFPDGSNWRAREDSNLRHTDSKSDALSTELRARVNHYSQNMRH